MEHSPIYLKEMTLADASPYFLMVAKNRSHLNQYGNDTGSRYPTLKSVEKAIENYSKHSSTSREMWFGIWASSTFLGSIDARPYRDGFEIGYWLGKQYTGHGYATTAVKLLAAHVHATLYAQVENQHISSIHVLERTGFRLASTEGSLRTYIRA